MVARSLTGLLKVNKQVDGFSRKRTISGMPLFAFMLTSTDITSKHIQSIFHLVLVQSEPVGNLVNLKYLTCQGHSKEYHFILGSGLCCKSTEVHVS